MFDRRLLKLRENFTLNENLSSRRVDPINHQIEEEESLVSVDADIEEKVIDDFMNYCVRRLGIESAPSYEFVDVRDGGMTTGSIDIGSHEIKVLRGHRALADAMRTLAHELVHLKQMEDGEVERPDPSNPMDGVGTPLENEANAMSGALVKGFIKLYGGKFKSQTGHDIYEL